MTRYLLAAIAALTVALGASGWLHLSQAKKSGELALALKNTQASLEEAKRYRKAADDALTQARRSHAALEYAETTRRRTIAAAVLEEPAWATTPVPPAVLEALNETPRPTADPSVIDRVLNSDAAVTKPAPGELAGAVPGAPAKHQDER